MTGNLIPGLMLGIFINIVCNSLFTAEYFGSVIQAQEEAPATSVLSVVYFKTFSQNSIEPHEEASFMATFTEVETSESEVFTEAVVLAEEGAEDIKSSNSPHSQTVTVPIVPFYSQSDDINWPDWRSKACGVVGLAMIMEFYSSGITSPQKLLEEGLADGHFLNGVGWTHMGLSLLARKHGFKSEPYDYLHLPMDEAYSYLLEHLRRGPVIASVFHGFDPKSPIPHLAVINGIKDGAVFYNDPAEKAGGGVISVADFKTGWKKRFITVTP